MLYYLIVCRSLTYAQRTASALERAGITAHIMRSPKSIAGEGCSHSVKVSQRNLPDALRILHRTEPVSYTHLDVYKRQALISLVKGRLAQ